MKSKLAYLAMALVCLSVPVKADTTVVDISATCDPNPIFGMNCALFPVNLQAQATVTPVTGQFLIPDGLILSSGTENEVLNITGTLNGSPVSNPINPSTPSWLELSNFDAGDLQFSVGGADYSLFPYAGAYALIGPGGGFVDYSATVVATPEPPLFVLLAIGLTGLAWRRLMPAHFRASATSGGIL
jgi:hypothetical protein